MQRRMFTLLFVLGTSLVVTRPPAQAHVNLLDPPSWIVEDPQLGDPQKDGPCGTSGTATAGFGRRSNVRTKYKPGEKVKARWTETIYHPGWFRISFDDAGRDAFTAPKSKADIVSPAKLPVLADGLFADHKGPAGTTYEYEVTLPTTPCKTCTLQVLQFMLDSPDRLYFHCADIEIAAAGTGTGGAAGGTAGTTGSGSAGQGGTAGTGLAGMGGKGGSGATAGQSGTPTGSAGATSGGAAGQGGFAVGGKGGSGGAGGRDSSGGAGVAGSPSSAAGEGAAGEGAAPAHRHDSGGIGCATAGPGEWGLAGTAAAALAVWGRRRRQRP